MPMTVEVTSIPVKSIEGKVQKLLKDRTFGLFAATTWHKLYEPYVPYRTGMLNRMVVIEPWQITHTAPYAKVIYHGGRNGHAVFSKTQHPLACKEWSKAARATKLPALRTSLQAYVDRIKL